MNPYQTIWTFIFFLNFSIRRFPLLPVGCQSVNCRGYLTVEPAPPILMGSDMMVYCHITQENYLKSGYILSLELNGQPHSESEERLNCTTARFRLTVHRPKSTLICKMRRPYSRTLLTVCGLDLHSGLPPDKPTDISCQTSRNSDKIDCSWNTGQATYQNTSYNISVSRENGTQIRYDGIQRTEFTMLRTTLDENKKYQLSITAYNHFGKSKSDPFILCVKDVVMPESPSITHIEFWNSSAEAMLHWKTPESSEHLTSYARIRTHNGSWVVAEGLELRKAIITLQGLEPLTEYEFQIRVCNSRQGLTLPKRPPSTPSSPSTAKPLSGKRPLCSKWSPSVKKKSPGKGPSQQLCVWRALGDKETNGLQNVTVFWMPLPPEDYSGEVHQYEIFLDKNDQKPEVACPATVSQCSFQVSADVQSVSVSAVTSYGKSPPSAVHLRHSGFSGPALIKLAPAGNGSVVILSWSWPMAEHESDTGELLGYVVEWTPRPVELHWQRVAKDQTSTFIKGLTAGVRYNVSLYAVTTRGVSDPSFGLVYAREEKPLSGPNMSILVHETTRVLIQWGELALDQQRGFVKTYTIYLQGINASDMKQMTVSASGPRQMWLDCPEGALVIYLSASNSAGEGPRGNTVSSQLAEPAAGLMAGLVFTTNVLMVIIANLICCRCVRKRIKQKCISLGPAWLVVNLPKPGNSKAIRLLQQDESASEPLWSLSHSDPTLSPIVEISQEREDMYPIIHTEGFNTGLGQDMAEGTSQETDTGTVPSERLLDHVGYKPQIATSVLQEEEEEEVNGREEEQRDVHSCEQEDRCSLTPGGLLGCWLSTGEVDFSTSSLGITLSSVNGLSSFNTPQITSPLYREVLFGESGTDRNVDMGTASLGLQQNETVTPGETDSCLSQYMVETTQTNGYFPQKAALDSAHN